MGIGDSMKVLTDDIVASYDERVKALKDIVTDTHKTVKGFAQDRKEMSGRQAEDLSKFVKDLAKNVENMLKGFKKNHQDMSEEQAKSLVDLVKNLTKDVGLLLDTFNKQRKETSEELKKKLTKEIKDIQSSVQILIGEYASDMAKARRAWHGMASALAKAKEEGVMSQIKT